MHLSSEGRNMETLLDLLHHSSQEFGEATALAITPGVRQQRWSYRKLWEFSGRVAGLLRDRGIQKGDRVVIWSENRPEWVLAYFGCLRAGAVGVPLDVRSAPDFVSRIIAQTAPKLAFCSRQTASGLPEMSLPVIVLEDLEELLEGPPESQGDSPVAPADPASTADDVAVLMFTSGTTGDPKGVILTHRNLMANIMACRDMVPLNSTSRLMSLLPLSHMLEQTAGLLVPLSRGASIIFPTSRQPRTLFRTMQRDGVTNFIMVPQALELIISGIEREVRAKGKEKQWRLLMRVANSLPLAVRRRLFREVHRQMGGKMRYIISGGAYLDPQLARKWSALGIPVLQGYGTTEASPVITTNTFPHNRLGSVGKVLPGQEIRIAADGEVLTRGANVFPGYWQNPEATAAAFEDGWYLTGDLGYLDRDGFLFLKGRKKDLIVLPNGQNVYPEDLESLLNQQSGVKDSVVLGLPSESGAVRVHAVLLMEEASRAAEAVSTVNRQVSDHQRIRGHTVWPQEDFPRTHTLKVRKPLVLDFLQQRPRESADDPENDSEPATTVAAPPASALQKAVASVCSVPANTLTPGMRLETDLGLDSLGRVGLLSAIEEELGVSLGEDQIGPETTLAELEGLLEQGSKESNLPFPSWSRSWWCRALRPCLQSGVVFPLLHFFYRFDVKGREHLRGLRSPVLFASNHNVKLDSGLTLMALPPKLRRRLCPAAAADDVFGNPIQRFAAPLLGNAFPFAREGSVRVSLERLGWLMDRGWSILIYPEGRNTRGSMIPFKSGTGMVAVAGATPVVPVRVVLHQGSVFDRASLFSRGRVEVRFGPPLVFPPRSNYHEATEQLELAVRAL